MVSRFGNPGCELQHHSSQLGLGVGMTAAYRVKGDQFQFYQINPDAILIHLVTIEAHKKKMKIRRARSGVKPGKLSTTFPAAVDCAAHSSGTTTTATFSPP